MFIFYSNDLRIEPESGRHRRLLSWNSQSILVFIRTIPKKKKNEAKHLGDTHRKEKWTDREKSIQLIYNTIHIAEDEEEEKDSDI